MTTTRPWPRYLSPGWIAAYGVGALGWCAIYELGGLAVVIAVLAGGTLAIIAIGELISTGHVLPEEHDR